MNQSNRKTSNLVRHGELICSHWSEESPASISGLHNKGNAIFMWFIAAGIPHIIWRYANGAMTDTNTIKIWFAMANSDDPESAFEQKMQDASWRGLRIDTRTLKHVSKDFVDGILKECNGNEDADDLECVYEDSREICK